MGDATFSISWYLSIKLGFRFASSSLDLTTDCNLLVCHLTSWSAKLWIQGWQLPPVLGRRLSIFTLQVRDLVRNSMESNEHHRKIALKIHENGIKSINLPFTQLFHRVSGPVFSRTPGLQRRGRCQVQPALLQPRGRHLKSLGYDIWHIQYMGDIGSVYIQISIYLSIYLSI